MSDPATAASIVAFQKRHGITADGVIGRQTALALRGKFREARRVGPGELEPTKRTDPGARPGPEKTKRSTT